MGLAKPCPNRQVPCASMQLPFSRQSALFAWTQGLWLETSWSGLAGYSLSAAGLLSFVQDGPQTLAALLHQMPVLVERH